MGAAMFLRCAEFPHVTPRLYIEMSVLAPLPLDQLPFDNRFVRYLSGDATGVRHSRQVTGAAFSMIAPEPAPDPSLVAVSDDVVSMLGIDASVAGTPDFAAVMGGSRVPDGAEPFAMNYGGHQFGHWAGQLGDGRAIALGEIETPSSGHQTLQLKGVGQTPYSRRADGLAVLRSSVREFLCSEAMHHLGVPTTRALSLVTTGDRVLRDVLYDGHADHEPGAVVCRVAPSFLRFGNFQIFAARDELDILRELVDFTIRTDFPHLGEPSRATYVGFFNEVVDRTIEMIVHWMRVGFVHGVMNTDNMSILGLTIDYGPYGWLEGYDPDWTPNTTDAQQRRYRFANQPGIGQWNLMQLANALYPLIEDVAPLQDALDAYGPKYEGAYRSMMVSKLGLRHHDGPGDDALIQDLLDVLTLSETDMTLFFRSLGDLPLDHEIEPDAVPTMLGNAYYEAPDRETINQTADWLGRYRDRVASDGLASTERRSRMHAVNPKYVLRNYLAQLAIDDAENGDYDLIADLATVLRDPYADQRGSDRFAAKRPEWARNRPGCSMLSCSS